MASGLGELPRESTEVVAFRYAPLLKQLCRATVETYLYNEREKLCQGETIVHSML